MDEKKTDRVGQVFAALGKSLCYLILYFGMQMVVGAVAGVVVSATLGYQSAMNGQEIDPDQLIQFIMDITMPLTLVSGLLTIAFILVFYLIRRKKLSEALLLRPLPAPVLLTGLSLTPAVYLVVDTALSLLPEAWLEDLAAAEVARGTGSGTLMGVLVVGVLAPFLEEFIFRGLMMNRLSRVMPGWLAVVLSAAVFGLCHGQAVWIAYAFVMGLFLGFIALRTGSVWPSILIHLAVNLTSEFLALIPNSEEAPASIIIAAVLLVVAVAAIILNRKAIAALFRPAPKQAAEEGQNAVPPVL